MTRYVLRRLLVAIPSLLIASLIVFSLPRLLPGDVVQLMLEEKGKDLDDLRLRGFNGAQWYWWGNGIVSGALAVAVLATCRRASSERRGQRPKSQPTEERAPVHHSLT